MFYKNEVAKMFKKIGSEHSAMNAALLITNY
jgi:hypothetical protein